MSIKPSIFVCLFLSIFPFGFISHVFGQAITLPHTFQNGQPANADHVNQNFNTLLAKINDNSSSVVSLASTVNSVETSVNNIPQAVAGTSPSSGADIWISAMASMGLFTPHADDC